MPRSLICRDGAPPLLYTPPPSRTLDCRGQDMADQNTGGVHWFRDYSAYIRAHRGKTFVVCLPDACPDDDAGNVYRDLLLLQSLGVRLVLVRGVDERFTAALAERGIERTLHSGLPVTTTASLSVLREVAGAARSLVEAAFSLGLVNAPGASEPVSVASGNFVKARPFGIHDGRDLEHYGEVRSINTRTLTRLLDQDIVTLLTPVGYSPSGETYELDTEALAYETAVALAADKLIYFGAEPGVLDDTGELIRELPPDATIDSAPRTAELAMAAAGAGVERCHLVSFAEDGALLTELFTRDGSGTQITGGRYETLHDARAEDLAGILALIEPLMEDGLLVKRSRESIEAQLERYVVIERDGLIIACAALHGFGSIAELATLATHPDYRGSDCGDRCLAAIEARARKDGHTQLFVTTTRGGDWFAERGFGQSTIDALPDDRQSTYSRDRNSQVFIKVLRRNHNDA